MPVDHSKHAFFKDLGTDWLALDAAGAPLARAATEDGVRHAAPGAAEYVTGKKTTATPKPKQEEPKQEEPKQEEPKQEEPAEKPQLDHDGDGKPGGSKKGEEATARKRKPVA